jgi:hypothetical protein
VNRWIVYLKEIFFFSYNAVGRAHRHSMSLNTHSVKYVELNNVTLSRNLLTQGQFALQKTVIMTFGVLTSCPAASDVSACGGSQILEFSG